MEHPPNVGTGILDAPFFPDEIGDDPRGPAVDRVTGGFGSGEDDGFEFLPLGVVELARPPRLRFSCEGGEAVAFDFLPPSFDGGEGGLGHVDDFVVVETA